METLRKLVGLARCRHRFEHQPLKFLLVNDAETNAKVFRACVGGLPDRLKGPRRANAGGLFVMLGDTEFGTALRPMRASLAQSMMLGAVEVGFGGCMLGSINRPKLRELLEIPERYEILLVLALGKPVETVVIDPVGEDGSVKYWRDEQQVHHVPKRSLDDLILD